MSLQTLALHACLVLANKARHFFFDAYGNPKLYQWG